MCRMRPMVPTFKQAPVLPGMPFEEPLSVRRTEAGQVSYLR